MRKLIVSLSAVVIAGSFGVTGTAAADGVAPNVIGGTQASTKDYPFAVFLVRPGKRGNFCGGSIIAPDRILTAGHCVSDQRVDPQVPDDPATVQVVAGRDDERLDTGVTANVTKIALHPKWDGFDYDFAVLTLDRPLPYRPIRFAGPGEEPKWQVGTDVTVLGWGATTPTADTTSPLFEKTHFPVVDGSICHDYWGQDDAGVDIYDPAAMICAGDVSGQRDSCSGDSGGPLISGHTLVGLVSFGPFPCAQPGVPAAVYAKVAAAFDWICAQLRPGTAVV